MTPTQEQIDNLHPELKKIYDASIAPGAKPLTVKIRHLSNFFKTFDTNSILFGTYNELNGEYEGFDSAPLSFTAKIMSNACWIETRCGVSVRAVTMCYPDPTVMSGQTATIPTPTLDVALFTLQDQMMQRADMIVAALTP